MHSITEIFSLPLKNPVIIFALLLLIIFMVPYIFEKIRIPSLVGLILMGTLVGEHGFNILLRNSGIVLFGTIGVLFIMFLAGLEIDILDFKKFKFKSITFGFFTFAIPMVLGTFINYHVLNLSWISAILLASMYASHTLLAYPLASKFKINKNEAVTVAVGGTMITDTAALIVLAIIANSTSGELNWEFWRGLGTSISIFFFIVIFILPKIAYWFFKRFETGGSEQFLFVLSLVFLGGAGAEIAGIEPIIGAFMVGLAINPLIPHTSALMNRLEFVGNILFIPFFLISVGMLIDLKAFFHDLQALKVAAIMTATAMAAKYIAAFITAKCFKYTSIQKNLIFSLSNAQAAATLAAVLVGYRLELLDKSVLNGTIMMILVTCVVSSMVMQKYGKIQHTIEHDQIPDKDVESEKILVSLNRPQIMHGLLDLALLMKGSGSEDSIHIVSVVDDTSEVPLQLKNTKEMLEEAKNHVVASGAKAKSFTRIDMNIANGIINSSKELYASTIILGWQGRGSTSDMIFGTKLDQILGRTNQMVVVSNIVYNINTTKRIVLVAPRLAAEEEGFKQWLLAVISLAKGLGLKLVIHASDELKEKVSSRVSGLKLSIDIEFKNYEMMFNPIEIGKSLEPDDLLIVISSRVDSVSYEFYLGRLQGLMDKYFTSRNFIFIYPGR